ncbi:acyl-CoA thioesterase [Sneathiella sp. CAU 1612]|uniref:Acyl-CoA thioesterase n=1 Tax=Sneathiella sedimenti TaxID=2816034 RepID=A0ABS3F4E6_9PROT|nr:thioesterase family protein [Sneathiella sedimenti]MBO0333389.1 acyl-CoA thioesterase [Sneathiella sedimenti]
MARQEFHFFHPFRVRYSEIDAQSVVFNAHYLTYFDTAITEFFRHLGYNHQDYVKRTGKDFHLVKSLVLYEKPILFDAEIEVGVRIEKIGRSSITFALAIFAKGEETRYCTGEIVWVNTDQTTHKPEPVDNEFLELFETFETVKK